MAPKPSQVAGAPGGRGTVEERPRRFGEEGLGYLHSPQSLELSSAVWRGGSAETRGGSTETCHSLAEKLASQWRSPGQALLVSLYR